MAKPLALTELQRGALESGDVGCGAHSARRHSIGNVPSMIAMVAAVPRQVFFMPFSALAPVEFAQAAMKIIAPISRFDFVTPEFSVL